ncbi:hypothetical protein SCHPADRAFT_67848 [Schizopora paradoxa]|uniref:Uncharacterized protein n=1 Tax=Schizopora paradoxa TaxID=27342 RepID=A0A0H2S5N7_9AGAM|nr:hypothetical protein SCHPADRAFT_67848 [Schizopora paradoxa]
MKPRTSGRSAGGADESDSRGSSKSSDELLQNASLALDATIALAPLVPIPALSSVFSCAQIIVETAKKVREDRRAAAELAQQAVEMTRLIHETISGKEDRIDNDLRKALEDFELGLEDVRNIMLEQTSANFIRRLTRRAQFSERLSRCNSRLAYSMRTFSALSQVRLEVKFDELRTEVGQLRKRHDDGYRIYHVGDLAFTRNQLATSRSCSYPYHDQHSTSSICDRCAEISGAVRKGEIKLVKLYRNDAAFRAELDFLKLVRIVANPHGSLDSDFTRKLYQRLGTH